MKTILFTDHPDIGSTFIIETNAPDNIILQISDYSPEDVVDFLIKKGYSASIGPTLTHIFDMPNMMLEKIF